MSHANLKIQKGENLDAVRLKTLAKIYEIILALPGNSNAGQTADDSDQQEERAAETPHSLLIISEEKKGIHESTN